MRSESIVSFVIKRYIKFDKTQPFISISAILAFLGVAIGVMVLIVAMAIMNGFDKEFQKKLFAMNNPITIYPKVINAIDSSIIKELESSFPSMIFSPFLRSQAVFKSDSMLEGVVVFGVDFEKEKRINEILRDGIGESEIGKFQMVIGDELRREFGIEEGDRDTLIFTNLEPTGLSMMPTIKKFETKAHFKSGLSAYDRGYIFTTLESLELLKSTQKGYYDGIHIYSQDPFKDIERLKEILPYSMVAVGWWEQNGNFFAALQMEKRALFIVLMLIILIASLNIISSLLMTVMNRRREIALLLTLGASESEIKKIFFYLGNIIGMSGLLFGVALSFVVIKLLEHFPIISLPADVYGTDKLPLLLSLGDFLSIVIGATLIVLASSYYPAKKATQIDALMVLRFE